MCIYQTETTLSRTVHTKQASSQAGKGTRGNTECCKLTIWMKENSSRKVGQNGKKLPININAAIGYAYSTEPRGHPAAEVPKCRPFLGSGAEAISPRQIFDNSRSPRVVVDSTGGVVLVNSMKKLTDEQKSALGHSSINKVIISYISHQAAKCTRRKTQASKVYWYEPRKACECLS